MWAWMELIGSRWNHSQPGLPLCPIRAWQVGPLSLFLCLAPSLSLSLDWPINKSMASRASQQKLCPATPSTPTPTLYSLRGCCEGNAGKEVWQNFIAVASGAKFAQLLRRQMSKEVASESSADGAKRPTPPTHRDPSNGIVTLLLHVQRRLQTFNSQVGQGGGGASCLNCARVFKLCVKIEATLDYWKSNDAQ